MSRLDDFLALPNVADVEHEILVSKRLGTFKVKPLTLKKYNEFQNRCRGKVAKNGVSFDTTKFNLLIAANQVIDPDITSADFLSRAGFSNPVDFIEAKFYPGEVAEIANKVVELSGFDLDVNEEIEEAKN